MDQRGYTSKILLSKNTKLQMYMKPTGVGSAVCQTQVVGQYFPLFPEVSEAMWLALANEMEAEASGWKL